MSEFNREVNSNSTTSLEGDIGQDICDYRDILATKNYIAISIWNERQATKIKTKQRNMNYHFKNCFSKLQFLKENCIEYIHIYTHRGKRKTYLYSILARYKH